MYKFILSYQPQTDKIDKRRFLIFGRQVEDIKSDQSKVRLLVDLPAGCMTGIQDWCDSAIVIMIRILADGPQKIRSALQARIPIFMGMS